LVLPGAGGIKLKAAHCKKSLPKLKIFHRVSHIITNASSGLKEDKKYFSVGCFCSVFVRPF
jgi:hypothetical protein